MKISKPKRGKLLAVIPLFTRIRPLERPRRNFKSKGTYQPKKNQLELLDAMSSYDQLKIDYPVIVDTFISFALNDKDKSPTDLQYGDEDNLRKALNDALKSSNIILDDRFVVGGENFKWFSTEDCCLIKIFDVKGEQEIEF